MPIFLNTAAIAFSENLRRPWIRTGIAAQCELLRLAGWAPMDMRIGPMTLLGLGELQGEEGDRCRSARGLDADRQGASSIARGSVGLGLGAEKRAGAASGAMASGIGRSVAAAIAAATGVRQRPASVLAAPDSADRHSVIALQLVPAGAGLTRRAVAHQDCAARPRGHGGDRVHIVGSSGMNRSELAERVATVASMTKEAAEPALDTVLAPVAAALARRRDVAIAGIGRVWKKNRAARNPRTGEGIAIGASSTASLNAAKALREALKLTAAGRRAGDGP